jgi:type I restriction enzyme S subunit
VIVIRAKENVGDRYLSFMLKNDVFIEYVMKGAKGVKMPRGDIFLMQEYPLAYPSKPEQQKIADCLSSIDDLITAQTQKLATLKTHKKGLMQHLFPAEGEILPKLRFPEFQDAPEWEENLLDSKVIKVGSGITPRGGDKNYKNNGRPFVRSQNVGWGVLLLDDVAYIDEQTHATFPSTEIENGDVLLNITGASIGRCAVADYRIKNGNVNQHVCIIRLKTEELTPEFLNQYLLSQYGQKQIDSFQAGGNRQGLNFAQVRSFVIPHPYRVEQIKVAQFLSSIDDLITAQTQKLATLKTHKKALMQQLFPAMEEVSS